MGIPTIAMHEYVSATDWSGGTMEALPGRTSDATDKFDIAFGAQFDLADIWEDGAPMANGRVFQVSAMIPEPLNPVESPLISVRKHSPFARINIPVVYERGDDEQMTCFYYNPIDNVIGLFRGKFHMNYGTPVQEPYYIPFGYVPVYADATAETTAPEALGGGSPMCLVTMSYESSAGTGIDPWGIIPVPYWRPDTDPATASRLGLGLYPYGTPDPFVYDQRYGTPVYGPLCVNESSRETLRPQPDLINVAVPRTYRRGDSTPVDWVGRWP